MEPETGEPSDRFGILVSGANDVVPNIRAGSITETLARIALEITGPSDEIDKAIAYIESLQIPAGETVPVPEEAE